MSLLFRGAALSCGAALALALAACGDAAGPTRTLVLTPDTAYVRIATTLRMEARTAAGEPATGVSWSTSDSAVATVSDDGVVTGRAYGTATVTASGRGAAGRATVRVTGTPGLAVAALPPADTIGAVPAGMLVAELRDERGLPRAGEELWLRAVLLAGTYTAHEARLVNPATGASTNVLRVRTDSAGCARAEVRLGHIAGTARIAIHTATLLERDTARLAVLPGAPVAMELHPADTAVFRGTTVRMRPTPRDRRGNVAAVGAVTWVVDEGTAAVDATGAVATPAYGTSRVTVRMDALSASTTVGVLPAAAVVVGDAGGVYAMNLDGTARRLLAAGEMPAASPDGRDVVYAYNDRLHVVPAAGGTARELIAGPSTVPHYWPQYSPDGAWVLFFTAAPDEPLKSWRVRPDGTGLEQLGASSMWVGHPALSPDGTRAAVFSGGGWGSYIHVLDLQTGRLSGRLARGHSPSWSPTGEWIAYSELGGLAYLGFPTAFSVVRPDGTEQRIISPVGSYEFSPRWSPDGAWVIGSGGNGHVRLVELATGAFVQLPADADGFRLAGVSWLPGGPLR